MKTKYAIEYLRALHACAQDTDNRCDAEALALAIAALRAEPRQRKVERAARIAYACVKDIHGPNQLLHDAFDALHKLFGGG